MRAVFLDIDGVLLPFGGDASLSSAAGETRFPDECLSALSSILDATGAVLVLSSTWRCSSSAVKDILRNFQRYAAAHGGPLGDYVDGFDHTTCLAKHDVRQWEIIDWLRSFTDEVIESWVALDDDDSLVNDPKHRDECAPRTVLTSSAIGLTASDAEKAIRILLV